MRIFTMLFLPGMLLGCGRALADYARHRRAGGLDLSGLGLDAGELEQLTRRLAVPYYSAAAVAMFLFALLLSVFRPWPQVVMLIACIALYLVLQVGTLAYLYYVVKRK